MNYHNYVAVDWSQVNMAIARMTDKSDKIKVIDVPSDIKELQIYLKNLKGSNIITIEETTTSQWLYTELNDYVDKVLVCDPYRNKLLSEGPKNDKIDAKKLVHLLKAGLLKEVYHSGDEFLHLRKLVSAYEDLIKAGVRVKNQKQAILRANGLTSDHQNLVKNKTDIFVLKRLDKGIISYETERELYKNEFKKAIKANKTIKNIHKISGIGDVNTIKLVSRVVEAKRFKNKNHFLSYSGLIKLEKISGGRSYGKKNPRYCRMMKSIFKTAALVAIGGNNQFNDYYNYLITEKNYTDYNARNATARRIATIAYGVLKSGKKYDPFWRKNNVKRNVANQ